MEPLLPIPNRTVKRDRANDSALACVKVGHRQTYPIKPPALKRRQGVSAYEKQAIQGSVILRTSHPAREIPSGSTPTSLPAMQQHINEPAPAPASSTSSGLSSACSTGKAPCDALHRRRRCRCHPLPRRRSCGFRDPGSDVDGTSVRPPWPADGHVPAPHLARYRGDVGARRAGGPGRFGAPRVSRLASFAQKAVEGRFAGQTDAFVSQHRDDAAAPCQRLAPTWARSVSMPARMTRGTTDSHRVSTRITRATRAARHRRSRPRAWATQT